MRVEGRNLEYLRHRQPHFLTQRAKMRRRQMAKSILDQMKVFDQQIATARAVAEQCPDVIQGAVVKLPPLRCATTLALAGLPDTLAFCQT